MKRIALVVLLALIGFYGLWPAWSGYRIRQAIENEDAATLEGKIEFPAVRAALKPTVTAEVERTIERALKDAGPLGGLISGQIKGDIVGRIIESSINSIVTPENVIKIAHDGKNLRESIERVMKEQVGLGGVLGGGTGADGKPSGGGLGGLGGILEKLGQRRKPADPAGSEPKAPEAAGNTGTGAGQAQSGTPGKRRFGLANIKSFRLAGPLGFAVGVARNPAAAVPDVIAELRFTGFDWKVVSLIPRLEPVPQ